MPFTVTCLAVLVFIFTSFNVAQVEAKEKKYETLPSKGELTKEVNLVRADAGLKPLSTQANLENAAKIKGMYMGIKNYFDHWSPDGLVSPWYFLDLAGYKYKKAGENLALCYASPKEVVKAMMASPLHRDNLLSKEYINIGIEVYSGVYKGSVCPMVVMYFGAELAQ